VRLAVTSSGGGVPFAPARGKVETDEPADDADPEGVLRG
jgi:hypothetical protein